MALTLRSASSPGEIETVRGLLRQYAGYLNSSLGAEHICLENYERELAELPGPYAEPAGVLLIAFVAEQPAEQAAGCAALKPLKPSRALEADESACEMKRLWVRPEFRGHSIGLALAEALIDRAREKGYTAMYLDTVPGAMKSANAMYQKLGFQPVERYTANPILGANPSVAVEFFRLGI
jgi:GNAT superfamily N-acetyltransferase